jgi:hypothetical protein
MRSLTRQGSARIARPGLLEVPGIYTRPKSSSLGRTGLAEAYRVAALNGLNRLF